VLRLLLGLGCMEVNHCVRLSAMGSVRALVVVKGDPAPDAAPCLPPGLKSVRADAFILEGPPQTLDEDVNDAAPFNGRPCIELRVWFLPLLMSRSTRSWRPTDVRS
jgi:hypothetical protein